MTVIMIVIIAFFLILWVIGIQRKLVVMDENVKTAMNQIGVQLSSRFDALIVLLELFKGYEDCEVIKMIKAVKSRRSDITANSSPDEVWEQEEIISEALSFVILTAEKYPEWKTDPNFVKHLNAVDSYERMIRTSCLIYNDSASKFNRELRMFPISLVGGMFGFRRREYMEAIRGRPEVIKQPI